MKNFQTFNQFVNENFNQIDEGKIVYKRNYTEQYPAMVANERAAVRNIVLDSIRDGVITEEELQKILSESGAHDRWSSRNSHFFKVTKEGVKLSSYGFKIWERIKNGTAVNEGRAFVSALKEAREKGEKTFEFNGKTYNVLKEAKSNSSIKHEFTTNAKKIEQYFNQGIDGYYLVKGGDHGENEEYWDQSGVEKWILYSPDWDKKIENKYVEDGLTKVELEDGEFNIGKY